MLAGSQSPHRIWTSRRCTNMGYLPGWRNEKGPPLPSGEKSDCVALRVRGAALTRDLNPSPDLLRKSTSPFGRGDTEVAARSYFMLLFRRHAQRGVEAHHLAVEIGVVDHVQRER